MTILSPQKRWIYFGLSALFILSAAVFCIGREAASWRPIHFGHANPNALLTVSPDGRFLVANRQVISVETGQLIGEVSYGEQCQFSADSKRLAFAYHHDAPGTFKITVYALPSLTPISRTNLNFRDSSYYQKPTRIYFSNDLATAWYMGDNFQSGDVRTGKCQSLPQFQAHSDFGDNWSISPDKQFLVANSYAPPLGSWAILYRLSDGKEVRRFQILGGYNTQILSISPDNSWVLETHENHVTSLYDVQHRLWQKKFGSMSMAFSPDSQSIATLESLTVLSAIETKNPNNVRTLLTPQIQGRYTQNRFAHLAWTSDSQYLFVSDDAGNLWKIRAH